MTSTLNPEEINRFLDRDHFTYRREVQTFFSDPKFKICWEKRKDMNLSQIREQAREIISNIYEKRIFSVHELKKDPSKYFAFFESFGIPDIGIGMKHSLTYHFFGSAIINLGTEKHQHFLDKIDEGKIWGCFAMTELGHGSNVRAIETTATYDHSTKEIVINTPTETAQKYWIGGSANHGNYAAVFAQLIVNGESQGVHPIIVQLRSDDGKVMPGVTIVDVGLKHGLNAVDNGRIWFDNHRVPRDNLLDRFATIDENGNYVTSVKSQSQRFALNIGELIVARMMIGVPATSMSKLGLAIAIKYAHTRRQFGLPDQQEELIINYKTHTKRLVPALATCYANNCFSNYCKELYSKRNQDTIQELHILVACFKIASSWDAAEILQTCRECCGGQGYLSRNLICGLRADMDAFVTIDGDNTMLLQQISRYLLRKFQKQMSRSQVSMLSQFAKHSLWASGISSYFSSTSSTDSYSIRSAEFQLNVFRWREERLLYTLAQRLQKKVKSSSSPLQAWNDVLDHANELSIAFIQRVMLEAFVFSIAGVTSGRGAVSDTGVTILASLRSLYALNLIQKDSWFLTSGTLNPNQLKVIREEINALCSELKPHLLNLVDAFHCPEYVLRETIAGSWETLNERPKKQARL